MTSLSAWRGICFASVRPRCCFVVLVVLLLGWPALAQAQVGAGGVPPPAYYGALNSYDGGDYRAALQLFQNQWNSGIKNGATRWIDSICFHTMMGECYYQLGSLPEALDEYNAALALFQVHSDWMMNLNLPPTIRPAQPGKVAACPWGVSGRPAKVGDYPDSVGMMQGRVNNNAVIQQGGVVQQPLIVAVNYKEIVRCTTVALRRRRELMGVVARFDPLSNQILGAFTGATGRPVAPPGHWSVVWAHLQVGLAYAAMGNDTAAYKALELGTYAGGEYAHPFTGTALFEMGRIELTNSRFDAALNLFAEASFAAWQYQDRCLLEECFRYGQMAHLLANKPGVYPPLAAAMKATRGQGDMRHLYASLCTLAAENAALRGDARSATSALNEARISIIRRDLANGQVGARFNFASALLSYQAGKVGPGDDALALALGFEKKGSLWLWHIRMADGLYMKGSLTAREAMEIYQAVLREPTQADWLSNPLETLAATSTPHSAAIERWFEVAVERKENEAALEIADLCRRHRFYSTLPLGGRLLALRWLLEGPEEALTQEDKLEKQNILGLFPKFADLSRQAQAVRDELAGIPLMPPDSETQKKQGELLKALTDISTLQEVILREIAVRRQPCNTVFPPKIRVEDLQKGLGENQAVLAYFATPRKMYGFLLNRENYGMWEVGSPSGLYEKVATLLTSMGHIDGNRAMPQNQLEDNKWRKPAHDLFESLIKGAKTDFPATFEEVAIVPDGVLWYVPFEMLTFSPDGKTSDDLLLNHVRLRYVPTSGLAIPDTRGNKVNPNTVVALGKVFPRDNEAVTQEAFARLEGDVPGCVAVSRKQTPAPPAIWSTFFDRLFVFDEANTADTPPYDFSPLPFTHGTPGAAFEHWLGLPWKGPDLVVLPAYHTAAENSLRKIKADVAGADVFLPIMGMMAGGARTVLISRWRTAGQTSFDLMREFAKELPHATAAEAWQRSVMLAQENPIKPSLEPRVNAATATSAPPPAEHPFFWAGYLLVSQGVAPKKTEVVENNPLLDPKLEEKKKLLEEKRKEEELLKKLEEEKKAAEERAKAGEKKG